MPARFLRKVTGPLGIQLPDEGQYGAGLVFLPRDRGERRAIESLVATILEEEQLRLLGWREVPADNRLLGARAVASQPVFQQLFVGRGKHFPFDPDPEADRLRFERLERLAVFRVPDANRVIFRSCGKHCLVGTDRDGRHFGRMAFEQRRSRWEATHRDDAEPLAGRVTPQAHGAVNRP